MRRMPPIFPILFVIFTSFPILLNAQTTCTPGTSCNDNNPCTINDTFDSNCDCIGTLQDNGIDSDGDGTNDCFDLCPNDPNKIFPGSCGCGELEIDSDGDLTPDCFDLCPNDPNKIFAGICGCGEVDEDSDGDTVIDCIDLCPNSTMNVDSDGDGVCDEFDLCPFGDDNIDNDNNGIPDDCENCNPSVGTACDDNNPCTTNDRIIANCDCLGEELDSDGDGVCDANDICPGGNDNMDDDGDGIPNFCDVDDCENEPGTACNDNDDCTINDIFNADCMCVGTFMDSDNDGVCDADDICNGGNDNMDSDGDGTPDFCDDCNLVPGTFCDDNDPCTISDVFDANCNCSGLFIDSDNDGICDADDICNGGNDNMDSDGDGIPDFCDDVNCPFDQGDPCNDGDDCTTNDAIDEQCNCVGTFLDSDNDGICDADDICNGGNDNMDSDGDGIPDFCDDVNCPFDQGDPCNDGDDCTTNDAIDEQCNCVGTFLDSDNDGICDADDICNGGNDNMDSDGDGIPDFCDDVDCPFDQGDPCNDGDDCTTNDAIDEQCNCVGTFLDSDNDGICDADDICNGGNDNMDSDGDGIPDFCDDVNCPFDQGDPCNDGDDCTTNDAIDEQCNCVGTFLDSDSDGICDADDICNGGNDNMDSDGDGIPDFCDDVDCPFDQGDPCNDGDDCTTNDAIDEQCNCVGTFLDSDNDGICDADDICNGGNDNMDSDGDGIPDFCDDVDCPFDQGDPCNDGDDCTTNDAIDEQCNCVGTFLDSDNDGICDADDICNGGNDNMDSDGDGIPDFCDDVDCPFDIGTPCDDNNNCTINDAYNTNCECEGVYFDSDLDGICDVEDKCIAGDDFRDDDQNGIPDFCDFCSNCDNDLNLQCIDDKTLVLEEGQESVNFHPIFPNFELVGCSRCENEEEKEGFIYLGLFQGHRYYVSTSIKTWYEAHFEAEENNGYLAVINSVAENDFLTQSIISQMHISSAFIGLQDLAHEGQLVWVNEEPLEYTNWNRPVEEMNKDNLNVGRWLNNSKWDLEYQHIRRHSILEVPCIDIQQIKEPNQNIFTLGTHHLRFQATTPCGNLSFCSYNVHVVHPSSPFIIPEANALRFYALKKAGFIELEWITNQGYHTHHFEVEHSTDNLTFKSRYNKISLDNSNELLSYQVIDEQAAKGTNFYRLKQVFHDGSFRLSAVQKVVVGYDVNEVFVFPNPVKEQLYLHLKGLEGKKATISIYNSLGNRVMQKEIESIPKRNISISLDELNNGLYYVSIDLPEYRLIIKRFMLNRY